MAPKPWLCSIVPLLLLLACSGFRTELYREETRHVYEEACGLYQQGDYAAARTALEDVLALDPDYGPAHAALGNLALIGEDDSGALAHYRAAIAADPELEPDLHPLLMTVLARQDRAPLQRAGLSLNRLYPLIMADRRAEVEALLAGDIPLRLLARDMLGITPGKLGDMQRKVAEMEDPAAGSARYRLFAGYLLFFGRTDDELAAALMAGAACEVAGKDRQEALVVLGQLHERRGNPHPAVDAYLSAVEAGLPLTEVAHHLARVYRVDIETVLPRKSTSDEERLPLSPVAIEITHDLPPSQPVDIGAAALPKAVKTAGPAGARKTF